MNNQTPVWVLSTISIVILVIGVMSINPVKETEVTFDNDPGVNTGLVFEPTLPWLGHI